MVSNNIVAQFHI